MTSPSSTSNQTPPPLPPISSLIRLETSTNPLATGIPHPSHPPKPLASTPWLTLQTISYTLPHDPPAKIRRWDMVTRTTKSKTTQDVPSIPDAVAILARLRLADDVPRILLVKQYRPPLCATTLELPAGLVDSGETLQAAALRELREETGYSGTVRKVHPQTPLSPGLTDENIALVEVDINRRTANDPPPQQSTSDSESIHVVSVPIDRFAEAVDYMQREEAIHVMHGVAMLAVGLSLSPF